MGKPELPREIKNNFRDIWSARLLLYGKSQPKYSNVIERMEQTIDSECLHEGKKAIPIPIIWQSVMLRIGFCDI